MARPRAGVRTPRLTEVQTGLDDGPSQRQKAVADFLTTGSITLPAQTVSRIMPAEPARKTAEMIEKHFAAHGVARDKLTDWWSTYRGGMSYARIMPAFIPYIVDGLITHLEAEGLA